MLLDVDGVGELDLEVFIKGCMRLSGEAQSKDILETMINLNTLGERLTCLEEKVLLVQEKVAGLNFKTETMMNQAEKIFADPEVMKAAAKSNDRKTNWRAD